MSKALVGPEQITGAPRRALLIIAGPSGVGKASVTEALLRRNPFIHRAMTFTTRAPRPGEVEKGQYHFVTPEAFEAKFASGEIMERTEVYGTGDLYGMPADLLSGAPPDKPWVLTEVDANGKVFLEQRFPGQCVSIFVTASPQILRHRILQRAHDEGHSLEDLETRLAKAREHMRSAAVFDYLILNEEDRLDEAVAAIETIIAAERLRIPAGFDLEAAFFEGETVGEATGAEARARNSKST
ncbi:MAG: hypothetical protein M5R40_17655 [Anaerolineae bacterium]|nr:hypothetical protein [Anaerolineae bacterium]